VQKLFKGDVNREPKTTVLNAIDKVVMKPANDPSRYKNLDAENLVRIKIFGKLQRHSIESLVKAGHESFPKIIKPMSALLEEVHYKPTLEKDRPVVQVQS
jgi:hypothetical protein